MSDADRKFSPVQPRFSLVALAAVAGLCAALKWPGAQSDNVILIGILLLSPMPVLLALLDVVERGGVVEYGGVKIDFFYSREKAMRGIIIAPNIGIQRQPVTDNSTMQMLAAPRQATTCDVVIIDLEDGRALWESCLLVLLAGAIRIGKPDKIVSVAKDANIDRRFQGCPHPSDLPGVLTAHPRYERNLESAWAVAAQRNLIEPRDAHIPTAPDRACTAPPTWLRGRLATGHQWTAFDSPVVCTISCSAQCSTESTLTRIGQKIGSWNFMGGDTTPLSCCPGSLGGTSHIQVCERGEPVHRKSLELSSHRQLGALCSSGTR